MRRPPSTEMKERGDLGKQKDVSSQTVEISLSTRTKTLGWSASGEKDGLVKEIVAKERGEKATGLTGSKKSRRRIAAMVRIEDSGESATILT
jgi:hypothetical protein